MPALVGERSQASGGFQDPSRGVVDHAHVATTAEGCGHPGCRRCRRTDDTEDLSDYDGTFDWSDQKREQVPEPVPQPAAILHGSEAV
jgi:hypothetical protein